MTDDKSRPLATAVVSRNSPDWWRGRGAPPALRAFWVENANYMLRTNTHTHTLTVTHTHAHTGAM